MQVPVFTDTEAETTVEIEESMLNQASHATNATKSIFNITLNDDLADQGSIEIRSYETHLKEEIKRWSTLWRESIQQLKAFKLKSHPDIDTSVLTVEKRTYLEKAPDLQRFLRDSIEFRQKAYIFVEKDYAEFQEVQNNLIEICEYKEFIIRERKIQENLANK